MDALSDIFSAFSTGSRMAYAVPIGSGHIHKTWLIHTENPNEPGFIMQKFNAHVFPDFDKVTENLLLVTGLLNRHPEYSKRYSIAAPLSSSAGGYAVRQQDGSAWRLFQRIAPGLSYDLVPDEAAAFEAGKIYGLFLAALQELRADKLHEVIPGFHSVSLRYRQLLDAAKPEPIRRFVHAAQELRFAKKHIAEMSVIPRQQQAGRLPLRVTHNDTKLNNVLFDTQMQARAVVDLDTVMPGLSLYDFGDLVRTAAATNNEDSAETGFSLSCFEAITRGYLKETATILSPEEKNLMPLAPRYMAYIMGIRFLADYLNGDLYYATHYPEQNLMRCRAQFQLMEAMAKNHDACCRITESACRA
ncbi:MAG: aminoglycoside phosphotransferase family protein [Balneolales bacterium]|nr:aminoglycoside phosphotransferase family protein [Balneolales bacterium]